MMVKIIVLIHSDDDDDDEDEDDEDDGDRWHQPSLTMLAFPCQQRRPLARGSHLLISFKFNLI